MSSYTYDFNYLMAEGRRLGVLRKDAWGVFRVFRSRLLMNRSHDTPQKGKIVLILMFAMADFATTLPILI